MKNISLFLCLFILGFFTAQIPEYYEKIDFSTKEGSLKNQITELVTTTHTTLLYYTNATRPDVWGTLKRSDLDPENPDQNTVLLIYGFDDNPDDTRYHRTRKVDLTCQGGSCNGKWAREHVFAKSLATPKLITSARGAGTDAHNLRAIDQQFNASRGNNKFVDAKGNAGNISKTTFYPGDEWRGSVARIIMYITVRYPVQCNANNTAESTNTYSVEMPDLYLTWNAEQDPSVFEKLRNEIIYNAQGNRNPFVDNPFIATLIWGGPKALDTWKLSCTNEGGNKEEEIEDKIKKQIEYKVYPTVTSDNYVYINGAGIKAIYVYSYNGQLMVIDNNLEDGIIPLPDQWGIYYIKVSTPYGTETYKVIKK